MSRGNYFVAMLLVMVVAIVAGLSPCTAQAKRKKPLSKKDLDQLHVMVRQGSNWKTRSKAAKVLGALRRPESVPHLIRCLRKDDDHLVRGACAWALGALEHPGSLSDLHRIAKSGEPDFVKKQAKKALNHILSRYPRNSPAAGTGFFRIAVEGLRDEVNSGEELTPWVQQYFLEHLIKVGGIEVGTEMDIEVDGENPDIAESFKPEIMLTFKGGLQKVEKPPGDGAGKVKVKLKVELQLDPVEKVAFKSTTFTGEAPFAGGDAPDDPWADDPYIEAQKAAVKDAVDKAYVAIASKLKLE